MTATPASLHLRGIASRIVAEALRRGPLRAALLTGSAGRGDSDCYSDLDLILYVDAMAARDSELWRLDALLEATFNILAVLAGLNRLYFSRFQLKGLRKLVGQMTLSPPDLADRLESLFRMAPEQAVVELERLIDETRMLVAAELPDLDLTLPFPPRTRQRPWQIGEE